MDTRPRRMRREVAEAVGGREGPHRGAADRRQGTGRCELTAAVLLVARHRHRTFGGRKGRGRQGRPRRDGGASRRQGTGDRGGSAGTNCGGATDGIRRREPAMRRNAVAIVGSAGTIPHALRHSVEALARALGDAGFDLDGRRGRDHARRGAGARVRPARVRAGGSRSAATPATRSAPLAARR